MVITENPLKTGIFSRRLAFLKQSQWWSAEKFQEYQLFNLRQLLLYCRDNVPYYQRVFKNHGIDVTRISKLSDIKMIPLLTKEDIQGHYNEFIPRLVGIDTLQPRSTGGSTGTPLTVYADLEFLSLDKANTAYYMDIAGYNPFDFRSLRIYGDKVPEELINNGEFWYEKENKLIISCYHYSADTLPKYVVKMNQYCPDYIHSRPSALLPLAKFILENRPVLRFSLGAIFLDGEILTVPQRDIVEQAFNTRVYNIYGHTEGCAVGISCKESRLIHFMPQVGTVELLDKSGDEVTEEGAKGEMVVTGFNNRVFPLIRYRTFDVGLNTNKQCPCGRRYKMLKSLDGRMQDFVVNTSNNLVPLAPAVFNYNDMDWTGIRQFQVYQDKAGVLLLKIIRESNLRETEGEMRLRITRAFNRIFNNTFQLSVVFVDELSRTRIGKFRYLEQKMDTLAFNLPK